MEKKRMRVLYSFPHKIGADRICYIAWQQVNSLARAGADMLVYPACFIDLYLRIEISIKHKCDAQTEKRYIYLQFFNHILGNAQFGVGPVN